MRETVGIPAGILIYSIATVILLIVVQVICAEPQAWSKLITASIALIAFEITCAAVESFSNAEGVKIVGVIIALFWLASLGVDMFSGAEEVMEFLSGGETRALDDFKGLVEAVWNKKICAGVTVVLALWTLTK